MTLPPETFADLPREEIPCPLCGTAAGRVLSVQQGRFGVVRCARCRLVRLSPRPAAAAVPRLYDGSYYAAGGYNDYLAVYERYRPHYERFYARRLRLLNRHIGGPGRILEVGCAHGLQLAWLKDRGWDVVGAEVSAVAASYAREQLGLDVRETALEDLDLPPASLDAAYMIDILEHLHAPAPAMARLARALKPGGILLVQCPFELFHWESRGQAWRERKGAGTIAPHSVPYHLLFFTPRTLRLMLERCGFRVLARYSGNYGAIRGRISPPGIKGPSGEETFLRFLYYKLGVRAALQNLALPLKQGSGLIFVATPAGR